MADLLKLIERCREVLYRAGFRDNLPSAIEEAVPRLLELATNDYVRNPEGHRETLEAAGLYGPQLELKLESFESALTVFVSEAGENRLREALDKGKTILSSLAGAIPGFGSFAQELVEFLLKELRK